jgi:hypothetical protein
VISETTVGARLIPGLVMRHGGDCIPRQYARFAGIANGGRRCNVFFDKLVKRGYAHEIRCVHNRARVYHVHHKAERFMRTSAADGWWETPST